MGKQGSNKSKQEVEEPVVQDEVSEEFEGALALDEPELKGDEVPAPGVDPFAAAPAEGPELIVEEPEPKPAKKDEPRYVLHQRRVDSFSVKRERHLLTPAVCNHCGFDVCSANNLPPYDELSEPVKLKVAAALQQHKDQLHTRAEAKVVRASELAAHNLGVSIVEPTAKS